LIDLVLWVKKIRPGCGKSRLGRRQICQNSVGLKKFHTMEYSTPDPRPRSPPDPLSAPTGTTNDPDFSIVYSVPVAADGIPTPNNVISEPLRPTPGQQGIGYSAPPPSTVHRPAAVLMRLRKAKRAVDSEDNEFMDERRSRHSIPITRGTMRAFGQAGPGPQDQGSGGYGQVDEPPDFEGLNI
jgi:hypothetical protein